VSSIITARILKLPLRWLLGVVAAVALAISAMFNGLAAVASAPQTTAVGSVIAAGSWNVTVVDASVISSRTGLTTVKAGDHWFAVTAIVDVTAKDTPPGVLDIFRLPHVAGLDGTEPDHIILARDGTDLQYLNPGMPERIIVLWEQIPSVPIPRTVDVAVYGMTFGTNNLTGGTDLLDTGLKTTVVVPVLDKRA
jgi:hypothetical protein